MLNRVIQGGALSLAFVSRITEPPARESVSLVSGVVATSPFLRQTDPIPRILSYILKLVSVIAPRVVFPLPADPDVSPFLLGGQHLAEEHGVV